MKFTTRPVVYYSLFVPFVLLLGGVLGKSVFHPQLDISKQESSLNFHADLMQLGSVGFNSSLADLIWVRTLMESDLEHYRGPKLNSWLFHRFDLISKLDPYFYENYLVGGQYLMIVKDDLDGAERIFSEGLKHFPDDMNLNWQMGFLWAYEKQEIDKAYPYFKKVSVHPARPAMFDSIFTRVSAQTMGPREAFSFAYESWRAHPEGSPVKKRLGEVLYSLKAEIDLECLNRNGNDCATRDFEGNAYQKQRGVWTASKPLVKTRLSQRKKTRP